MKGNILLILAALLIITLAGCSLLPPANLLPTPTPTSSTTPPSGYEPQPGDETLKRDTISLDMEKSSLVIMESYPIQVSAILNGSLSDPCHKLRVVVSSSPAEKMINLEVYSVVDTSQVCITVIEPFSATIPLGSFPTGHYSVYVNGELLGEFDA